MKTDSASPTKTPRRDGWDALAAAMKASHEHTNRLAGHRVRLVLSPRIDNREMNPGWHKGGNSIRIRVSEQGRVETLPGWRYTELTHGGHGIIQAECDTCRVVTG